MKPTPSRIRHLAIAMAILLLGESLRELLEIYRAATNRVLGDG
jgi:hypothetical protein